MLLFYTIILDSSILTFEKAPAALVCSHEFLSTFPGSVKYSLGVLAVFTYRFGCVYGNSMGLIF